MRRVLHAELVHFLALNSPQFCVWESRDKDYGSPSSPVWMAAEAQLYILHMPGIILALLQKMQCHRERESWDWCYSQRCPAVNFVHCQTLSLKRNEQTVSEEKRWYFLKSLSASYCCSMNGKERAGELDKDPREKVEEWFLIQSSTSATSPIHAASSFLLVAGRACVSPLPVQ